MSAVGAGEERAVSTFASLRVRNYRLYFFGQGVSVAGNWMQNIAVAWLVLALSHSGTVLGLVTAVRFVPLVLLGPWGGLVADRVDNRRLLTITQSCAAGLALVLAILSWRHWLTLPVLVVLVVLLGLINVFDGPSRQNLISQLVDRRLLGNAIALNSIAMNSARVLGPGVGGGIIAALGVTPCFFVNAASFAAVIASLVMMRAAELIPAERESRAGGQIMAGLRYVRRTPELFQPLLMVVVVGALAWEFPVTLPLMTEGAFHQDADGYGTAMSCLGLGAVAGAFVAARRRRVSVRSSALSAVLWGAAICAAALAPNPASEYVLLVIVGSGAITFNSVVKTLLQLQSAPHMRGRVMALWSMSWQGSTVIGAPIVGAVGGWAGPRYALLLSGLSAVVVGALVLPRNRRTGSAPTEGAVVASSATEVDRDLANDI